MVKLKDTSYYATEGSVNVDGWLKHISSKRHTDEMAMIRHACVLSQLAGEDQASSSGESCLRQGLAMADILADLQLDKEALAAAIVYNSVHYSDLNIDDVREHLGNGVAKLVEGVSQLEAIRSLQGHHDYNRSQIENLRKMLLAMIEDVRVVLIKLAERACIMRAANVFNENRQKQLAKETMDIFAPLANRLGVGQLKWELEDLAFRYLEPVTYKELANLLHERRIDREKYVNNIIHVLETELKHSHLKNFEITGRVKHIYSIYRKMVRKDVDYDHIYDVRAVRILVSTVEDCYAVLSIIHSLWLHIAEEFDDYIATPKENGYQSLHSVVIGPENKNIEVQIRTFQMHKDAELGIAAHWVYKEGAQQKAGYENKIAWLRQVLEWQKGLAGETASVEHHQPEIFADRTYVFTPTGDIIDLPQGATPLDFAYHIHSEVGHRCRGAKINNTIVPLTYTLTTGERVEILTAREANPSRDWLNPHLGYLKSPRARAKVHHWFKHQDYEKNLADGQIFLEKELHRLEIRHVNLDKLSLQLNFKNGNDMLAALGCGDIRLAQILNAIQTLQQESAEKSQSTFAFVPSRTVPSTTQAEGITIEGVGNLLTQIARCCQPVPGDHIIGFITQGRGVSIHRNDCVNVLQMSEENRERLIEVQWGSSTQTVYSANIHITAYDRQGLLRDITTCLANEKINLLSVNSSTDKAAHIAHFVITVEITGLESLSKVLDRINQLPNVISAKRQE